MGVSLLNRLAWNLLLGIVITIPLVFGAVHPIILALYVFLILVGLGSFLLFNDGQPLFPQRSSWLLIPCILIGYLFFQSVPLPLEWLELISPTRAHRLAMVNELAGTDVSFASIGDYGARGMHVTISLLAMLVYYLSLGRLLAGEKHRILTICYCLVGVGAFEALYGLIQFINPHIGILWLKVTAGRAAYGTIIYKNQYASMLNMLWPLAVACTALFLVKNKRSRRKSRRKTASVIEAFTTMKIQVPLFIILSGMMVLAVLFSLSRGGILAMVFVGGLLLILMPFERKMKLIFLMFFFLLIIGYGGLLGLDTIITRFSSLGNSGSTRMDIYLTSLPMLWDHWLTGIGLGSYALLSPVYLKGFPAEIVFSRAHNEYLELMIELGIPMAMLLFVWLCTGIIKLFSGLVSASKNGFAGRECLIIATASFCGLMGFFVHGVVDFGWRLPVNFLYAVTLLAITTSCLDQGVEATKTQKE